MTIEQLEIAIPIKHRIADIEEILEKLLEHEQELINCNLGYILKDLEMREIEHIQGLLIRVTRLYFEKDLKKQHAELKKI